MKTILQHHSLVVAVALVAALATASCSDNDYTELDKGSTTLTLTADQQATALAELNHGAEALTLSWTSGHNFRSGHRISYVLQLAEAGTGFATPYTPVDHETQVYDWSVNQEQLNDILLSQMGATAGREISVEARLQAFVEGFDEVQTASLSFTATPYTPVTSTLYLIGDATPGGWSADVATEMKRQDNGLFTWQGNLSAGELKMITTRGQFLPSYNNDGEGRLVLRTSDDAPDLKFIIPEAHFYQLTANLLTGEMRIQAMEGEAPAYDQLYIVGSFTGWGFIQMQRDPLDDFLFRYAHYFSASEGGEFKFGTSNGSWENMYKATSPNAPYTQTSMAFVGGYDPDDKWFLGDAETEQAYKICVDIRSGRERMMMRPFQPYEMIWLVGDATPSGWDLGNATAMRQQQGDDPWTFTWTGALTAGELKFTCDKQSDWNGAWFMNAQGNDVAPTGDVERMLFIDKSSAELKAQYLDVNIGDIDQKWQIPSAGTYTITLDQLNEMVSIVKN